MTDHLAEIKSALELAGTARGEFTLTKLFLDAAPSIAALVEELERLRADRDDLKHDIERHLAITSEQAGEIEAIRVEKMPCDCGARMDGGPWHNVHSKGCAIFQGKSTDARVARLEQELKAAKAESVARGRMLVHFRNEMIIIRDGIEEEGDRTYFGSTNKADLFKDEVQKLDDFKWDLIMAEKNEPNFLDHCRDANVRADKAEASLASANALLAEAEKELSIRPDHWAQDLASKLRSRMKEAR